MRTKETHNALELLLTAQLFIDIFDNYELKGIEKKYGKPIEHWMKELKKVSKLTHMEQVAHLKDKFEMGHGHANAIVAVFRKEM